MRISIGLPNQVADLDPTIIPRWAARAEELGFSSLGTVGRIAFPGEMDTAALAVAAGATSRIGLMTGVLTAPSWGAAILAKELASIDGMSGGRLTFGLGLGAREDDYPDRRPAHRGRQLDADLAVYRAVWAGERLDGQEPLVPAGTRQIPMVFGGYTPGALERMAREGVGYITPSMPPAAIGDLLAGARAAWTAAGRDGAPQLYVPNYSALTNPDLGRADVGHYYDVPGGDDFRDLVLGGVLDSPERLRRAADEVRDAGVDEFIVNPGIADLAELEAVAEVLL